MQSSGLVCLVKLTDNFSGLASRRRAILEFVLETIIMRPTLRQEPEAGLPVRNRLLFSYLQKKMHSQLNSLNLPYSLMKTHTHTHNTEGTSLCFLITNTVDLQYLFGLHESTNQTEYEQELTQDTHVLYSDVVPVITTVF